MLDLECDNISVSDSDFLFKDDYFEDCEIDSLVLQSSHEEHFSNFEQTPTDFHCQGCLCQRILFSSSPSPSASEMPQQKSGKLGPHVSFLGL